ncbi:MAG: hypothetical protein A2096_17945 [Spirochaetes bacterium GWF1_41_5]|nr:MAG: hypothetical protein A2096_17945 [Spirochaetes bacterium GWF1_41_5]HBE03739.1 hypothetical protein [Spirochaetia bacterium]
MPDKPNILLFFTDMQRADTIGALGNPVIKTPALDRLVKDGTSFTNAFTPCPVCIPARCSMQYGLYPSATKCAENYAMMSDNEASYPQMLGSAGYRTHAVGKCHFSPVWDALRGFHTRETQEEGVPADDDYSKYLMQNGIDDYEPHGVRSEMYYIPQPSRLPEKHHPSQWVGDRSLNFITRTREPWCLFSSFIHPHPPFTPPRPWHKLYRPHNMPLPRITQDMESLYTSINRIQNRYKYQDHGINLNLLRLQKAYYYAAISFVDYQIGRIIEYLEKSGQIDNTLIIFTSDHGEYLGDYHCFGKRSMHDASARIPFIIRYPEKYSRNRQSDLPVSLVDVMPTFLGAAGINQPEHLHGLDINALLSGSKKREYVFSQWSRCTNAQYMIAGREWKYFYSAADEKEFLFNRITDPQETRNAASLACNSEVKKRLRTELMNFLQRTGENEAMDETTMTWKKFPAKNAGQDYNTGNLFSSTHLPADPDSCLLLQDPPEKKMPDSAGYKRYSAL